jgi:NAD-dependent deacetylase
VVWFGERLPEAAFLRAERAAKNCDLFLSIGTSSQVYPAAGLIHTAIDHGAATLEINPNPTDCTARMRWCLQGKAGELLPRLVRHAFP